MNTAALFERLAPRYDELWTDTAIGRAQRDAVWRVTDQLFRAGDRVLDVGCGTGEDAAHLMGRGISVIALDASPAMVARARARGVAAEVLRAEDVWQAILPADGLSSPPGGLKGRLQPGLAATSSRAQVSIASNKRLDGAPSNVDAALAGESACRTEDLGQAKACPTTDGAISNFGALNCVEHLGDVARALGALVRPGGHVAICTMGRFCLWETLYYAASFNLKKAMRRLPGRAGDVYYPTVRQLRADFSADFELLHWTGIGMLVPPSYVQLPASVVHFLARFDRLPFLRACADHRLLIFRRK